MGMAKFPKRQLYIILLTAAAIILAASLETLVRVKDLSLFREWLAEADKTEGFPLADEEAYKIYVASHLSSFFVKIIIPAGLALHSYFAYIKLRFNGLFIFLWTVLAAMGLAQTFTAWNWLSVFSYINFLGYGVLATAVVSLLPVLKSKNSL